MRPPLASQFQREYERNQRIYYGLLLFIFLVFCVFMFRMVDRKTSAFTCETSPIIVQQGQTIWDIATEYCTGNRVAAVDANEATYGYNIQVGQQIFLVPNEKCTLRMTDGGEVFEEC